jgi:hypothetical protein
MGCRPVLHKGYKYSNLRGFVGPGQHRRTEGYKTVEEKGLTGLYNCLRRTVRTLEMLVTTHFGDCMKTAFVISEMARVLAIATRNYVNGNYVNLMMAIPSAVKEWEDEYRKAMGGVDMGEQWNREMINNIATIKSRIVVAFEFPNGFIA